MRQINLENVTEAGTADQLVAGGYICKYTNVEDLPDKQYLNMEFDIAEGDFKDYFKNLNDRAGFWGGHTIRSYKESALPFFKRMCSAVSKSNPGYIFDGGAQNADEKTLVGKFVGLILGEEEYEKNNGEIGTRIVVHAEVPVETIRKGDFKVPAKKCLQQPASVDTGFVNVPDSTVEELPFT